MEQVDIKLEANEYPNVANELAKKMLVILCEELIMEKWQKLMASGEFTDDEQFLHFLLDQEETRQTTVLTSPQPPHIEKIRGRKKKIVNYDESDNCLFPENYLQVSMIEHENNESYYSQHQVSSPNIKNNKPSLVCVIKKEKSDKLTFTRKTGGKVESKSTRLRKTKKEAKIKKSKTSKVPKRVATPDVLKRTFTELHVCPVCMRSFADILPHLNEHKDDILTFCDLCHLVFDLDHLKTHVAPSVKCDDCGRIYAFKHHFYKHVCNEEDNNKIFHDLSENCGYQMYKTDSDINYSCNECKKIYPRKYFFYLKSHLAKHKELAVWVCTQCGKPFYNKQNLNCHEMNVHSKGQKFCKRCKVFVPERKYHNHIRRHNGKQHLCPDCGSSFYEKKHLRRHQMVHAGLKPFNCEFCEKTFAQKVNRDQHQRLHTGEHKYECTLCGKKFILRASYTQHVRIHTGVKVSELSNVRFGRAAVEPIIPTFL